MTLVYKLVLRLVWKEKNLRTYMGIELTTSVIGFSYFQAPGYQTPNGVKHSLLS